MLSFLFLTSYGSGIVSELEPVNGGLLKRFIFKGDVRDTTVF